MDPFTRGLLRIARRLRGIREDSVTRPFGASLTFSSECSIGMISCWWYGDWKLELFHDGHVILTVSDNTMTCSLDSQNYQCYRKYIDPKHVSDLLVLGNEARQEGPKEYYELGVDDIDIGLLLCRTADWSWGIKLDAPHWCLTNTDEVVGLKPLWDGVLNCMPIRV
jgi:hypothetical protein